MSAREGVPGLPLPGQRRRPRGRSRHRRRIRGGGRVARREPADTADRRDLRPADFGGLSFTINDSTFRYGAFLNAVITFVLVAAAIFFVVVKPLNAYLARRKAGIEEEEPPSDDERRHQELIAAIERLQAR